MKMIAAFSWVALTVAIAIAARVAWPFHLVVAALALLPPLALLLWWNGPAQTTTQAIDEVRRGR